MEQGTGIDYTMELPPSSWRQADAHRAAAFRWVRFPSTFSKKDSILRDAVFFGAGYAKRISQIPKGIYFVEKSTLTGAFFLEQGTGIEPASVAWEATILPMN